MMIRFATIGSNFIVHSFLDALCEVAGAKFDAVYSRDYDNGRTLADKYGASKVYTNLDELASDDAIDAVYIASPNSLHFEQSLLMLQAGKHVLCEKPIASNMCEFAQMMKVANDNGVILLEAMKNVYCPGFFAVWDNLVKLGVIRNVIFNFSQYSSRYDKFKDGIIENAFNPEFSNGSLMDIGVYCIHLLLALFGEPNKVNSSAIKLSNGIDGAGTILCEYDGFLSTLVYSKIANSHIPSEIQGENATMIIDKISNIEHVSICYNNGRRDEIVIEKNHTMSYEIEKFLTLIANYDKNTDYNLISMKQMKFLDTVRGQLGIVFPADKGFQISVL